VRTGKKGREKDKKDKKIEEVGEGSDPELSTWDRKL
jgi:hypothetical protein